MPLRILLTNASLGRLAGTETFTYDLATRLVKMRQSVECYTEALGIVSGMIPSNCTDTLNGLPWKPDVIHAQHTAGRQAHEHFPDVRTVAVHHGPTEPEEMPKFRADHHVAVSEEVAERIPGATIIRNGIDLQRFKFKRRKVPNPRILVMAKTIAPWIDELEREAGNNGMEIEVPIARIFDVEEFYYEYDFVAAIGRTALEAAACGCRVLVWGPHGSDGMLTPDSYWEIRKNNFSGRRWGREFDLEKELAMPHGPRTLRLLLSQHHNSFKMAKEYLKLYAA